MDGIMVDIGATAPAVATARSHRPEVVVIGAGFGRLSAALRLGAVAADVTVIDRRNYHLFQPLLYQVADSPLEGNGFEPLVPRCLATRRQRGRLHSAVIGGASSRRKSSTGLPRPTLFG